jgi:hypothetical protein
VYANEIAGAPTAKELQRDVHRESRFVLVVGDINPASV